MDEINLSSEQEKPLPEPENIPAVEEENPTPSGESLFEESGTPQEPAATPTEAGKKLPGWLKKGIIWFVILGMVFLSGVILVNLTSVAPMRNSLRNLTSENLDNKARVNELQNSLADTQEKLTETTSKLSDAQNSLSETHDMLVTMENQRIKQESLSALKYNIALARVAVANEDKLSARQNLLLAQENLDALKDSLDADIADIIQERLDNAKEYINTSLTKTAEELRTLTENLERIE